MLENLTSNGKVMLQVQAGGLTFYQRCRRSDIRKMITEMQGGDHTVVACQGEDTVYILIRMF